MKISFQKKTGNASLGVAFFWKLTLDSNIPGRVVDHFIPELFFDYLFVKRGRVQILDSEQGEKFLLPRQSLKSLFSRPLQFEFSTPLVLYGARMSLRFAESFWGETNANRFSQQAWAESEAGFESFAIQATKTLQARRVKRFAHPLFTDGLTESNWLAQFSPRHKRRLYASIFGLSRKDLSNIRNMHSFLEQTCDFGARNPRIIQHINPEVFYDQPHLNRLFKKMTGFSPLGYFEAGSFLQDNLMSASYNADSDR